ncbi:MAG: monovalent cation/H+ antiporter subunit D family protein [Gemmatimonadales bacterium]|jgi:multicomponent Na+:H+ antiporter subunit D|nr:monovalent cation/H+ antiporter subunit D family protein [Gemmatimonadales bacterium]NCG34164.1 monovalent cation/H+ antiporter subunit D family protein [Pseudomonadota bacterium]MBT3498775.1 monovalent cation/H+ antiporter subunit D family protein [Gemmatimonadales bacterium]MBT3775200.1 monovalent cation/H+ antiporter subunit D family protein [Gemmatimonadales bacterium]MBT3956839.1 monovalent cation/H+ antiporter subunit D family protein [Gemmatimonadales bacterium]
MSGGTLIAIAMLLPVVGGFIVLMLGKHPNARETVTLLTGGLTFWHVYQLLPMVQAGERPRLDLFEVVPGVQIAFEVEPLGMLFALVAAFLWPITSLYAIGYMRGHHEENQSRFFFFFAVAIAGALGVAFSANLFTLFAFYEVLTLCTFPLVTHHQTEEAKKAGRIYLGILLTTSVGFQLLAIIWTWQLAGTVDFTDGGILAGTAGTGVLSAILVLFVFGVGKAAVMPFHRWLPAAMVAPTPVSALLHAVAVVKAGVFTVLKVSVYVFGIDLLGTLAATPWLAWVAATTIILGSLVAFTKDNLKARLAYSTISQLSYIVLGALLANEWGIIGGGMHIAMHAFGKITLFFAAGAVMVAAHEKKISRMHGLGRTMPITFGAFFVGSLSIIGLPPAGGSWSKWFLAMGTLEAGQVGLLMVLMLSSLLGLYYLLEVPVKAFFFKPLEDAHHREGIHEAPTASLIAIIITAIMTVGLFVRPDLAFNLMAMVIPGGVQ